MRIRNILAPTDFSACADAALNHAVSLAKRFDATLHLVHVVNELDAGTYGLVEAEQRPRGFGEEIESAARDRLHEMADAAGSVDVQTEVIQQLNLDVDAAIGEFVRERGLDLVVMGTHGRTGLGRMMLGSVANQVIRRTAVPVMTVRTPGEQERSAGQEEYENVLAPIDFSEHSRQALRLSKQIAARYDARLHLLFVAERRVLPTFSDTGLPGVSVVEMDPDIVANAEAALEALDENIGGPDVDSAYHVRKGEVADGIVEFAEDEDVDLLTMATRGLAGINRFLLGSNTERVVRVAPCPVVTVPAKDEDGE